MNPETRIALLLSVFFLAAIGMAVWAGIEQQEAIEKADCLELWSEVHCQGGG